LKGKLAFNQPSIFIGGNAIYEEGEGAEKGLLENLKKTLSSCPAGGMQDGSTIRVEDFSQDLEVEIIIRHFPRADMDTDKENAEMFSINGKASSKRKLEDDDEGPEGKKLKSEGDVVEDDDDIMEIL